LIKSLSKLLAAEVNVEYDDGIVPDVLTEKDNVDEKLPLSTEVTGADLGEVDE